VPTLLTGVLALATILLVLGVAALIGVILPEAAFKKALLRATEQDLRTHHRTELAKLDMEEANIWRSMDANKDDWRAQMAGSAQLRGVHVRRSKLLGLDAPAKFDVRALYGAGSDEASEESLENERAWSRLSREDQERFYEAPTRPAIDTTSTVTSGTDDRTDPEGETED
jgi:hypothetical protein